MINYNWIISSLECVISENNLENIIKTIHWRYRGTENNIQYDLYGSVNLDTPDPNNYIPYENLTQTIVENWLESNLDITSFQQRISDEIELIKNPVTITLPLPNNN